MFVLTRQQGQIIRVMCSNGAWADIFVKKIHRKDVELGFTGPKDQIAFIRGEKDPHLSFESEKKKRKILPFWK